MSSSAIRRSPFLAYSTPSNLAYAPQLTFSEMDFVVPGPGARDGSASAFGRSRDGIEAEIIRYMAETQQTLHPPRSVLCRAEGPSAAADRLPEPVLRVRQVRPVAHPWIAGITTQPHQAGLPARRPRPCGRVPFKWGLNT